jgi:hypothetical protein
MNVKRGLWRIWLVSSLLLATAVTVMNYSQIKTAFEQKAAVEELLADGGDGVPEPCAEAARRKMDAADRTTTPIGAKESYCWYPLSEVREHWPEYADQSNLDFVEDFYLRAGSFLPRAYPWELLALAMSAGLGLPLVTLAFGWAVAGFAGAARKPS